MMMNQETPLVTYWKYSLLFNREKYFEKQVKIEVVEKST